MIRTLKTLGITLGTALALSGAAAAPAIAAPFTLNFTATILESTGTFSPDLAVGLNLTGTYVLDTDEANASGSITTPSVVPGHEFTSFYDFPTPPYSFHLEAPALGESFDATSTSIVVNNNLFLDAADTGGVVATGTHDWIELLGSTAGEICLLPGGCAPDEFTPADGDEWTLAIFGDDDWFTDGSVIPDALPATFTSVLVGIELDAAGNEVGFVFAQITGLTTDLPSLPATEISAPATAGLAGLFLIGAARIRRRK
jgi:hypothetical protein